MSKPRDVREIQATELLEWARSEASWRQVDSRHVLPGGLALAMVPVLVNWRGSSLGFRPEDYYLAHNINLFNNPVGGVTLLGAVRIPSVSVERVEFVEVMSKVANREVDVAAHAMLRFVFKEDRRPLVLTQANAITPSLELHDLVLSWEAWRPPAIGFDPVEGLDPARYALSLRAYAGFCRCMNDAILDRPWRCYSLQLPDIPHFADELLYVSLLLGDAVARHTIGGLLDRPIATEKDVPADYKDPGTENWEMVKSALGELGLAEDPIQEILDGKISYQLILRSCVTMALTSIDSTLVRSYRRAGLGESPRIRITPESIPGLLDELAQGHRMGALLRVPTALQWLMHHQSVLPGKSHLLLDEIGLLERDQGRIVKRHYDNRIESPYGRPKDHLIY